MFELCDSQVGSIGRVDIRLLAAPRADRAGRRARVVSIVRRRVVHNDHKRAAVQQLEFGCTQQHKRSELRSRHGEDHIRTSAAGRCQNNDTMSFNYIK